METHEPIIFHKKRDFTGLFNTVFEFLRQEFKPFFKRLFVVILPVQLLLNIVIGYAAWKFSISLLFATSEILYFFLMIFVHYIYVVYFASVVYSYLEEYIYDDVPKKGAFESALKVFGRVLPTGIIVFFIFGFSLIVTLVFIGQFVRTNIPLPTLFAYIILFFYLFLHMPLFFMFIIKVAERKNPFSTIARCYRLARGYWWKTYGSLILLSIIQWIFSFVFYLPTILIKDFAGLLGIDIIADGSLIYIALLLLGSFGTYFSVTIFIYLALQYFNILERKEGQSLLKLVDGLKDEDINPEQENDGAGYNSNPELN